VAVFAWGVVLTTVLTAHGASDTRTAKRILKKTGVQGGLVVHVGCDGGGLTAALHASDRYLVHGLDSDGQDVGRAREYIQSLGLYGKVAVEQWDSAYLPYADNVVALLVSHELGGVPMDEVVRVLAPRGIACIREKGRWRQTVKPWPEAMDEWTHYLHDASGNAVAQDALVGPPGRLRWVAGPPYGRSHEIDSSVSALVSARGRLFYILDEGLIGVTDARLPASWALIARDAFSGVLLWRRPVPNWGWREWKREEIEGKDWTGLTGQRTRSPAVLPRRLVAQGDRVYATLGYNAPVSVLDAATGEALEVIEHTEYTQEILHHQDVLVLRALHGADADAQRRRGHAAPDRILCVGASTGNLRWKTDAHRIAPLSLTVGRDQVLYNDLKETVCLDLATGGERWRARGPGKAGGPWDAHQTLVARDDVVLLAGVKEVIAYSAETGDTLWRCPGVRGPGVRNPPDLFVVDGLVWTGGSAKGRDLRTGEVKRSIDLMHLVSPGHHFRCYRSKATRRYLLWPKRGVEFIDVTGADHMRHDWLRAPCKLGFLPCNGLLYMAPHQCFCYPGVKLSGFNALASEPARRPAAPTAPRLQRGPAFGTPAEPGESAEDWTTFRHDALRSGATASPVPTALAPGWQVTLGGRLTQPVIAAGRALVARTNTHSLHCYGLDDGRETWSFTAGGRIDSPPTIHQGLVLFGCADGHVYCLRASDGALVWRFRAAPEERRIVAFGQVESAWPLHGSVLVKDSVAYCAAGRSSYLDGGICVHGLRPDTGEVLYETRLEGPHPDPATDVGRPFDMEGAKADVLVSDGTYLYMQQTMLDRELKEVHAPRLTIMGDRKMRRHLLSTAGLLDDTWWNRTFWMYGERWPGFYIANQAPKAGQLLVFDDTTTYGVKCFTRRNRHSPMFFPATDGYLLFADDNDNEGALVDEEGRPEPVRWLPEVNEAIRFPLDSKGVDKDKGTGFVRTQPPLWATWIPLRVQAMVLARNVLFVAGPPDLLDEDDPLAAFEGRRGAELWAVSPGDGEKLASLPLDSPPVFDGMAAAQGRLLLSLRDGTLLCLGENNAKGPLRSASAIE